MAPVRSSDDVIIIECETRANGASFLSVAHMRVARDSTLLD
jgi:hypothetical protein